MACAQAEQLPRYLWNHDPSAVTPDELTRLYQRQFIVQQCERWSPEMHSRFCAADRARAELLVLVGRRLAAAGAICIELWISLIIPHAVKQQTTPIGSRHYQISGQLEFSAVLFIPRHCTAAHSGQRLYIQQQFIEASSEGVLLPGYLSFIRAVVNSQDLPRNDDDNLHQKIMRVIRRNMTKKSIELFQQLAQDGAVYNSFWAEYGAALKRGVVQDTSNAGKLAKLLLFESSFSLGLTSLEDYQNRMPDAQQGIVCIDRPENPAAVVQSLSPEVLHMADAADWEAIRAAGLACGLKLVSLQDWDKPVSAPPRELGWRDGMRRIMRAQGMTEADINSSFLNDR